MVVENIYIFIALFSNVLEFLNPLPYANWFVAFQIITLFILSLILLFTIKAYNITKQPVLLNFSLGFILLETSFAFVLLNRFYGQTGIIYHTTFWIHDVLQTAAFVFIALTYYLTFTRKISNISTIIIPVLVFAGLFVISIIAYFSVPPEVSSSFRVTVGTYLYAVSLGLLIYVLYNISKTFILKTVKKKEILNLPIPLGFLALAIGQVLWIYWGLSDANTALFLANLFLVIGLGLFATVIFKIWRHRHPVG